MTSLDFDELNKLVDASLQTEDEDGVVETVRKLLKGAYEQAVLDWETEFEYIYMNYPEMLDKALEKPTEGISWEERIRSWYKGENPNMTAEKPISNTDTIMSTSETSQGGATPPTEGTTEGTKAETAKETKGVPDVEAIKRVVETEYHRMYNTGAYDTVSAFQQQTGHSVYKRWNTALDDRVRDTHIYLEGDRVPLDNAFFTFDGDSAMYPGGFTLPQNNIRCRCLVTYEYE